MPIALDLKDETIWSVDDLRTLISSAREEIQRRDVLANSPAIIEVETRKYQDAIGLTPTRQPNSDGTIPAWVRPTNALDAYIGLNVKVTHNGKVWISLVPINVWEPGVSGWREITEVGATPAAFNQPTGAHDAYKKGDLVTFLNNTWESLQDGNVWSPIAYPFGWKKL